MDIQSPSFKRFSFVLIAFVLIVISFFIEHDTWTSGKYLHTVMESIATVLALLIGIISLIHYYTNKTKQLFLFIGAGFIGTSFLELYHAIVTSAFFDMLFPSPPESLIPWSWIAARLFLSILFVLSYYHYQHSSSKYISESRVYFLTFIFTLLSFIIFALVPMPPAYYEIDYFHRPEELIPAALFLYALIGFYKKGLWKSDDFEYWLVLSLIVNTVSQIFFMTNSHQLFDAQFDLAHFLKKLSYILVLTGLLKSIYRLFVEAKNLNLSLNNTNKKFQSITDATLDAIIMIDEKGDVVFWNKMAEKMTDYTQEDIIGKNLHRIFVHQKYYEQYSQGFKKFIVNGEGPVVNNIVEHEAIKKGGQIFPIELSISALQIDDRWHAVGIMRDMTQRKEREQELHNKLQKFIDAQNSIVILTNGKKLNFANKIFFEFFGCKDLEQFNKISNCICERFIEQDNFFHLGKVKPDEAHWIVSLLNLSGRQRIVSMIDANGTPYAFSVSINPFENNEYIVNFTDISDAMVEKLELKKEATVDALTNVYNRVYFTKNIEYILEECKKDRMSIGIVFFDIDHFKKVNDIYGHGVGDKVLSTIASLAKKYTRDNDIIIRWGGEEFIIICEIEKDDTLFDIAEHLRSIIEEHKFSIGSITCSFGCAIHQRESDILVTIKYADEKLYQAKNSGRNRVVC